jgi:hypothetical protein
MQVANNHKPTNKRGDEKMAKHIITCSRCGGKFTGRSEYDAEIAFDMHECVVGGHTIDELTDEELTALVRGEKTEEQIWAERGRAC